MTSSELTCESRPGGAYARECTVKFVVCISGLATYYRCLSPLLYDIESQMCCDKELVSTWYNTLITELGGTSMNSSSACSKNQPTVFVNSAKEESGPSFNLIHKEAIWYRSLI
uniref:Chitin-binding type-2 domain-containing protein n=1 Tax=Loa loa TaxID=7209 RepID=A0A1I7VVY7_LOALO